ncbi:organic cation transporter protein-like [Mizuhopecten yessoensis]|uniref:Solute carrier family 22 member 5 n=1 Tax=Mizuhopecten yessoensis TaxID=6573 RepID=A0A210QE60_MIZYE|nr:organic cation transporter protein-like [Mizuhopecten yessoensis]XP_021360559.1 organic cation transporter protein-like [Mizuhopecten yessoensis]XP_021360560.1 organic cation transporter protein-like [Mizuhopecten yessoensis]OWF46968.1 Solute carrier family 22 member 5 [Mizuhopecten yessoensis]
MATTYQQSGRESPAKYQEVDTSPVGDPTADQGSTPKMNADAILQKLGAYGRYQVLVFVSLAFVYMRGAWPVLASIFLAADPGHHCRVPSNTSLNVSLPGKVDDDGTWTPDQCVMYVPGSDRNQTQSCSNGWQYGDQFDSTILMEWDLVCDDSYLGELSTTIYMVGNTCGAILLTPLSDKFGRKKMILFMLWIQGVFGVATAFANSYILFTVLRFFIAALNMPIALTTYVMMTEVFPASHRALPSVGINCFWGIGLIFLSVFGYLVRDWSHLQLLISIPNFLTVMYYFFLPESIPWLVASNKYTEAEQAARTAAKINNITLPEFLFNREVTSVETHTEGQSQEALVRARALVKKYTILDLFKTPKLRRYTLILLYLWAANSLSYFGILFATPNLHGNLFLNLGISGAVEIPALFICMWTMQVYGRRRPHVVFLLLCGVMNIITIFVPEKTESGTDLTPLIIFLAMVGKFGITASYSVAYLYASEIFPTVVRNHAVGLASFFENIGGIAAPFIVYAATSDSMKKLPLVIFGVITLVAGILCIFLPETHKCPLPDTIEDVEKLSGKRRFRDNPTRDNTDTDAEDGTRL